MAIQIAYETDTLGPSPFEHTTGVQKIVSVLVAIEDPQNGQWRVYDHLYSPWSGLNFRVEYEHGTPPNNDKVRIWHGMATGARVRYTIFYESP